MLSTDEERKAAKKLESVWVNICSIKFIISCCNLSHLSQHKSHYLYKDKNHIRMILEVNDGKERRLSRYDSSAKKKRSEENIKIIITMENNFKSFTTVVSVGKKRKHNLSAWMALNALLLRFNNRWPETEKKWTNEINNHIKLL